MTELQEKQLQWYLLAAGLDFEQIAERVNVTVDDVEKMWMWMESFDENL